tara:strand:- start:612 stop:857 length:246 start_codon:yes stop_codon:yes gene_type:complete
MVWLKFIFICFILSFPVQSIDLTNEEIDYFNIIDINNDGFVSIEEINQSTGIIFQLIDINNDKLISLSELEELKEIIEILK